MPSTRYLRNRLGGSMARAGCRVALIAMASQIGLMDAVEPAGQANESEAGKATSGNAAVREGRSLYEAACSTCHGANADGRGKEGHGSDLRAFKRGFSQFVDAVKNGRDTGCALNMPAWHDGLADEQINNIWTYIEMLSMPGASPVQSVRPTRPQ
jgi:mono/diheme cytochrome c family protein